MQALFKRNFFSILHFCPFKKSISMAKFEMSKAFKEGALCDIFIPIEKFVLVVKAMREAEIFRPVCKVKSMSLLLFSKYSSLPNNLIIQNEHTYQNVKKSNFKTMRLWSFSELCSKKNYI